MDRLLDALKRIETRKPSTAAPATEDDRAAEETPPLHAPAPSHESPLAVAVGAEAAMRTELVPPVADRSVAGQSTDSAMVASESRATDRVERQGERGDAEIAELPNPPGTVDSPVGEANIELASIDPASIDPASIDSASIDPEVGKLAAEVASLDESTWLSVNLVQNDRLPRDDEIDLDAIDAGAAHATQVSGAHLHVDGDSDAFDDDIDASEIALDGDSLQFDTLGDPQLDAQQDSSDWLDVEIAEISVESQGGDCLVDDDQQDGAFDEHLTVVSEPVVSAVPVADAAPTATEVTEDRKNSAVDTAPEATDEPSTGLIDVSDAAIPDSLAKGGVEAANSVADDPSLPPVASEASVGEVGHQAEFNATGKATPAKEVAEDAVGSAEAGDPQPENPQPENPVSMAEAPAVAPSASGHSDPPLVEKADEQSVQPAAGDQSISTRPIEPVRPARMPRREIMELRDTMLSMLPRQQPQAVGLLRLDRDDDPARAFADLAFALAWANAGEVLAIDGALTKGSLAVEFDLDQKPGLEDVLMGRLSSLDACYAASEGLRVMPRGTAIGGAKCDAAQLRPVLAELKSRYRYLLVDAVYSDAVLGKAVAASCDALMLTIGLDETDRATAAEAVAQIRGVGGRLLGSVLVGSQ